MARIKYYDPEAGTWKYADSQYVSGERVVSGDTGGAISSSAKTLLITILRNAVFCNDQSANITALESALASGGDGGGSGGGEIAGAYSVINGLTNVTNSNKASNVLENGSYIATLTADDGYFLDTVSVLMCGVDVTESVYLNGTITILNVTGDIVITATAVSQAESGVLAYWDFTKSLVDTIGGVETTLKGATQDENGLHINGSNHIALTHIDVLNKTVEVVVGDVDASSHSGHGRFITLGNSDNISSSGFQNCLVYHNTGFWAWYSGAGWTDSKIGGKSAVANSVVRITVAKNGGSSISVNGETWIDGVSYEYGNVAYLSIGSNDSGFFNATIKSIKIYGEVQE